MTLTISRGFLLAFRQGLLMIVDAIERELGMQPRTAQLRKELKERLQPERSGT